jgi:hypothetical protein
MKILLWFPILTVGLSALAQEGQAPVESKAAPSNFTVAAGTRVPLLLINSLSTKSAHEGDQVYLETAFPIVISQKIVIPRGSYVKGTITQVKRPGRVKGRGEMYLRFDSLTLPNGVTRDFRGRVGSLDGSGAETLDKEEGKIRSDASKGQDASTIATTAAGGTAVGAIAGSATKHPGLGTGIGAAGGAAAGIAQVLLTRGPDIQLMRGTELDMVLDRALVFTDEELRFDSLPAGSSIPAPAPARTQDSKSSSLPLPGRRLPSP